MTAQQPANYLDQGSGAHLRAQLENLPHNGIYARLVSESHTQAWDSDQLALQRKINALAAQANTGVDPAVLSGADEFGHLSLEQLRAAVEQIKPELPQAVSEAWAKIGESLGEATTTLRDRLNATLGQSWQGQAAEQAADAVKTFTETSANVGTAASMVGLKVAFATRGSAETSRMIGPVLAAAAPSAPATHLPGTAAVNTPIPGSLASLVPTVAGVQSAESQKEEARGAALQVLRNVYLPGLLGGDQGVPVLPSVRQTAHPTGPLAPNSSAPATSTPTASSAPASPPLGSDHQAASTDGEQPASTAAPAQNAGSSTAPAGFARPDAVGPADSVTPATSAPATATTPAGWGPGVGGALPSGTGSLGGSDSGTPAPAGPGASVPGKPSPATLAGAEQGPVRAGAGRVGGVGAGAGMVSPAGVRGGEEKEHRVAARLAEQLRGEHLGEWIGQGPPALPAGGAIGAEEESGRGRRRRRKKQGEQQEPPDPPRPGAVRGEFR